MVEYFGDGDECHMAFHFPVMPRLYMAIATGDATPVIDILAATPPIPESCQWAVYLRNHDELTLEMVGERSGRSCTPRTLPTRRCAEPGHPPPPGTAARWRLAKIEVTHGCSCRCREPDPYYGDEIGMGDEYLLEDRDGCGPRCSGRLGSAG